MSRAGEESLTSIPPVYGCQIKVTNPDIGRTDIQAKLVTYGVAIPDPVTPESLLGAAEAAAKAALRHAKLMSLVAVDVEEWFALGDRIKRERDGAIGQIIGIRKTPPIVHAEASDNQGALRVRTVCGDLALVGYAVPYEKRSQATCRACGGQIAIDDYEPRISVVWPTGPDAPGQQDELREDDILYGLQTGTYTLP